jgi:CheY-like chemotaxis protein
MDLQEVVSEYLESPELKGLLESYPDVTVEFHKSDGMYPMRGSPVHLGKTIMNLIANGVEAIKGSGVVEVQLSRVSLDSRPSGFNHWRAGDYIRLTVRDTGVGIPEKDLKRIYEPFYSRKVMGKSGTGLGMAVVWGTIEDHKGHITLESKENEGTLFQLLFPAENVDTRQHEKGLDEGEIIDGNGQSLLVVDDSEEQRQIASDILEHLGYTVTAVNSGEAAIQYLKSNTSDLIVLDMLMAPGIDGLETYKRILDFRPDQKALIASGYSHPSNVEEARAIGVSAYVMKPYTVMRLGEAVQEAFSVK